MAVKPKFYPILPKDPRLRKRGPRSTILATSIPCSYDKRRFATWFVKSTKTTSTIINETRTQGIGTSVQSGTSNKSWRTQVAEGVDASTNYSRTLYSVKPTRYTCYSESTAYRSDGNGVICGDPLILIANDNDLVDQATSRLKNKLNGYIGNAQLAAPLAEAREIFRLVRQINSLGLDTVKALLAMKKTRGKSIVKAASDAWLGFGFGVNPMLNDIAKGANAILDYSTRNDNRVRITATATREYLSGSRPTSTNWSTYEQIAYNLGIGMHSLAKHMQGVHYVAGIDLQMRTAASYSVRDHLGLKVGALPGTLWELTPFSWVVDYAATVGPWLDDMFYTLPGTVKYVVMTKKYQSRTDHMYFGVGNSPTFKWRLNCPKASHANYVQFSRQKLAALPTRQLRIKSADEVAKFGLTKLLNLGSVLAGGRFRKV